MIEYLLDAVRNLPCDPHEECSNILELLVGTEADLREGLLGNDETHVKVAVSPVLEVLEELRRLAKPHYDNN